MKHKLITLIIGLLLLMFVMGYHTYRLKQSPPDPQIEALQAEVEALRVRMDDVESVQGYRSWEMDWRNRRDNP